MSLQGYIGDDDSILGRGYTSSSTRDDEDIESDCVHKKLINLPVVNKSHFFTNIPKRRLKRRRKNNAASTPMLTPHIAPNLFYCDIPGIVEVSLSSSSNQDLKDAALRTPSAYYSSRWVFKFFQDQLKTNQLIQNDLNVETLSSVKEISNVKILSNHDVCFKPSLHHFSMEDAITFSSKPRCV
jgi:hypothetical protein